jgi:ATP-dependent Clp protease ATP-binding subunit ClpC
MLHRILVSPLSVVVYVLLLAPLFLEAATTGDYTLLGTAVGFILFAVHIERKFIERKLMYDEEPVLSRSNLGCYVTFDVVKHIHGRGSVTLPKLLLAASVTARGQFILRQLGRDRKQFIAACKGGVSSKDNVLEFIQDAVESATELGEKRIDANAILFSFFKRGGVFRDFLNECDVSLEDLRTVLKWESFHREVSKTEWVLHPHRLVRSFGSFGRSWVQGYTNDLDLITEDISGQVVWDGEHRGVLVHDKQLELAVQVLSRSTQRNILTVGKVGVGKRTMVQNVCYMLRKHELEKGLPLSRQLVLKTEELMSGYKEPDQIFLKALKKGEESGKVVLIIENIALLMRSADANLRNVLTKFLQSDNVSIFGIVAPEDYHAYIKSDPVFDGLIEKIYLEDTSDDETMAVLMMEYFSLHKKYKAYVTYHAFKSLLTLTKRFVGKGGMPGKAVDILGDAVIAARDDHSVYTEDEHIRKAISLKAHMDVSEVSGDERQRLLKLEEALKTNIMGQEESILALVNTLKRARMDINSGKRPLGTFLFLGPTGVGKTYTAKTLAREYFGSEEALIRIDMNEYGNEESVAGIIGDPNPTKASEGFITKQVQDKPFSLILLDEIEKAHKKVLNLFLQILDEGKLTDSRGITTDFRNTIIIATSNAGALFIRDFIKENENKSKEEFKEALIDTILKSQIFSPEFVNRFDEVILYYPLSIKNAIKVALVMLEDIVREIADKKGYIVQVEEDVVVEIVKEGYSVEFGAREMRRVILDMIETFLADYLLRNDVKRGDTIFISRKDVIRGGDSA